MTDQQKYASIFKQSINLIVHLSCLVDFSHQNVMIRDIIEKFHSFIPRKHTEQQL